MRIIRIQFFLFIIAFPIQGICQNPSSIAQEQVQNLRAEYNQYFSSEYQQLLGVVKSIIDTLEREGLFEREIKKISQEKTKSKISKSLAGISNTLDTMIQLDQTINSLLFQLDSLAVQPQGKPRKEFKAYLKLLAKNITHFKKKNSKKLLRSIGAYFIQSRDVDISIFPAFWRSYKEQTEKSYRDSIDAKYAQEKRNRQVQIDSLSETTRFLEDRIEGLSADKDNLNKAKKRLEKDINTLTEDTDSLKIALNTLRAERKQLQGKYESVDRRKSRLENEAQEVKESRDSLHEELLILTGKDSLIKQQLDSLRLAFEHETLLVSELKHTKEQLERQVGSLKTEREVIKYNNELAVRIADNKLLIVSFITVVLIIIGVIMFNSNEKLKTSYALLQEQKVSLEQNNQELESTKNLLQLKTDELDSFISELHHRIKNNLQVVAGLLVMQLRRVRDFTAQESLKDTLNRINVMGIMHRKLYENRDQGISSVNVAHFIQSIVANAIEINDPSKSVRLFLRLEDWYVDMDKATDLGLIVNELISNCFKHAFKQDVALQQATLEIALTKEPDAQLSISDNGAGLPESFSLKKPSSFGMRYVYDLAKKRSWQITPESSKGGTTFFIALH